MNLLLEVARDLRLLASHVFDGALLPNRDEVSAQVLQTVQQVEALVKAMHGVGSSADGSVLESFGNHGFQRRYKADFLLQCLSLSHGGKVQFRRLEKVMLQSVRIACPQAFAEHVLQLWKSDPNKKIPSAGVMSHASFALDVAFMMLWRDRLKPVLVEPELEGSFHLFVDSSETQGRDWEMAAYYFLDGRDLQPYAEHVWELVQFMCSESPEGVMSDEEVAEESRLVQWLANHITLHQCVPVGLGARRSSLARKAHAIFHSLYLEAPPPSDRSLSNLLRMTTSITGDLGTESGLCTQLPAPFSAFFPYIPESADPGHFDDGDVVEMNANAGGGGDAVMLDLSASSYVPGMKHIIGNATKDLLFASEAFKDVFPQIDGLSKFLNGRMSRRLLLETCMAAPPALFLRPLLSTWPWTFVQWRWDSAIRVLENLLRVRGALGAVWDLGRLSGGGVGGVGGDQAAQQADPGEHESLGSLEQRADACIKSNFHWAYMEMVMMLGDVIAHFSAWVASCPCHGGFKFGELKSYDAAMRRRCLRWGVPRCPLAGFRAAEMAAGDHGSTLADLESLSGAVVLLVATQGLTVPEKNTIVRDFDLMKNRFLYIIRAKTLCFRTLPRMLYGAAHYDEEKARNTLRDALNMWDECDQHAAHPLSGKFFGEGEGSLRQAVFDFLAGVPRIRLPALTQQCAKFLAIPVIETLVERKHVPATKLKTTAPAASAAFLSLQERYPELEALLESQPEFMPRLLSLIPLLTHPVHMLRELNLQHHPDFQPANQVMEELGLCGSTYVFAKTAKHIIYHVDGFSMFNLDLSLVEQAWKGAAEGVHADKHLHVGDCDAGNIAAKPVRAGCDFLAFFLSKYSLDHFRERHGCEDRSKVCIYSLPRGHLTKHSSCSNVVDAHRHGDRPVGNLPTPSEVLAFGDDAVASGDAYENNLIDEVLFPVEEIPGNATERANSEYMFFSVMHLHPKKIKNLPEIQTSIVSSDLVVRIHPVLYADPRDQSIVVELSPVGAHVEILHPRNLQNLRCWRAADDFVFDAVHELDHASTQQVMSLLVGADAYPGCSSWYTLVECDAEAIHHKTILCELSVRGLVARQFPENLASSAWQFTGAGMAQLSLGLKLVSVWNPFEVDKAANMRSLSSCQLLQHLLEAGWVCLPAPSSKKLWRAKGFEQPLPFQLRSARSSKIMYAYDNANTLCHSYLTLLALCTCPSEKTALITRGVDEIPHLQQKAFYDEMLGATRISHRNFDSDLVAGAGFVQGRHRARTDFRLEESFRWGCISFKGLKPNVHRMGGWQADCPRRSHTTFRRKPNGQLSKTSCSLSLGYKSLEDRDAVKQKLMWWACQCHECPSKRAHKAFRFPDAIPDDLDPFKLPSDREVTDCDSEGEGRGRRGVRGGDRRLPAASGSGGESSTSDSGAKSTDSSKSPVSSSQSS